MVWGSAIAAGASFASGALSKNSENDARRLQRRRLKQHLGRAHQQIGAGFAQGDQRLQEALGVVRQGTASSLAETSRLGDSNTRRLLERERMQEGRLSTSLARRGLFNSTVYESLKRGIRDDTQRSLAELDARLAELRSGIVQRGAGAEATALTALASNAITRGQELAGQDLSLASYYGNQDFQSGSYNFGGLGSALDALFAKYGDNADTGSDVPYYLQR